MDVKSEMSGFAWIKKHPATSGKWNQHGERRINYVHM